MLERYHEDSFACVEYEVGRCDTVDDNTSFLVQTMYMKPCELSSLIKNKHLCFDVERMSRVKNVPKST